MANLSALVRTIVLGLLFYSGNVVDSLAFTPSETVFKNETTHLHNVAHMDSTNAFDIGRTGKRLDEIVQSAFYIAELKIDRTNRGCSGLFIPSEWHTVEFKLKFRSNLTVFEVKVFNDTDRESGSRRLEVKPNSPRVVSDVFVDSNVNTIRVNVAQSVAFALWDAKVNQNVSIPTNCLKLQDHLVLLPEETSTKVHRLLVSNSTKGDPAYMSYMVEDHHNSLAEQCFAFQFDNSDRETTVEIYLTLDGENQGKKIVDIKSRTHWGFYCTSFFVYLRAIGRHQYTFVVTSGQQSNSNGKDDAPLLIGLAFIKVDLFNRNKLADLWWYNNDLFDYSLEIGHQTEQFQLCDMMANCYPYDKAQANKSPNNQTIYRYSLSEVTKRALSHSPMVRLHYTVESVSYRLDMDIGQFRASYYDKNKASLKLIRAHLVEQKHEIHQSQFDYLEYSIAVRPKTRQRLNIPISTIDLRVQYIRVNITPNNTKASKIQLRELKFNSEFKFELVNEPEQWLSISTQDYIHVNSWNMAHNENIVQSFGIEFQAAHSDHLTNQNDSMIELKVQFDVGDIELYKKFDIDEFSIKPLPIDADSIRFNPNHRISTLTVPVTLIQSNWLQSSDGLTLNHTDGEMMFRFNSSIVYNGTIPQNGNITQSSIKVSRILIGGKQSYISSTPLTVQIHDSTSATVLDNFNQQQHQEPESVLLNGPFRLGYAVEIKAPVRMEMSANIRKLPQLSEKNCHKGPTYATLDCHYDQYQCPEYYFKYDSISKSCTPK